MGSWTKLLGIGANREPDVRELAPAAVGSAVRDVPVDEIHTNPFQPRRWFREEALAELAASVREYGVLQPLLVRLDEQGGYELIAGERRLRASKLAGRATVPVILVEMSDQEVAEVGLIENLQREDLHFLEEAESYKQLLGFFGLTAEKLAERLGKSASSVSGRLRLLKLEPAVRDAVVQSGISEKHAQALLKLGDAAAQLAAIQRISEANLTARETEQWVNLTLADAAGHVKAKPATAEKALASVRDVRMVLNVLRHMTSDLKRGGVPVQMNQRQEEGFLKLELLIPLKQAKK
jgi:ParB family chromosome partitioning protein